MPGLVEAAREVQKQQAQESLRTLAEKQKVVAGIQRLTYLVTYYSGLYGCTGCNMALTKQNISCEPRIHEPLHNWGGDL